MRLAAATAGLLLASNPAIGDSWLDYIRNYDLNDYAFGVALSTEQNPYVGAKNGTIAYPYLSSFRDSAFTADWFLIRDGGLGARWISESGWELGAIARVQTLGFGNHDSSALLGVEDRKWSIEAGPTIGWRGWPVHINWTTFFEPTNRHHGGISELALSLPMEWSRGYFVPSIEFIHQSSEYVNYYYAVAGVEATPTRPAYSGKAASNFAFKARWGYALSDKWLLSGSVGLEQLDSAVTDSPIVGRDRILSGRLGLAYNADVFQPRDYDGSAPRTPQFDIKVSSFQDSISTKVAKDTSDGVPGFETDIEDFLGAAEDESVLQVDATLRIGHYHRLEFAYFELGRNSTTTLGRDLVFGDETFAAGTDVITRVDAQFIRAGYSYSLVRDAQKELGVMGGVHFAKFDTDISAGATGQAVRSRAGTPLPVVGAHASVFLSKKTTVSAKLQLFRTDFDNYEGSLNYASLDIQYRVAEALSIGLGYSYYGVKLSSSDGDVTGYLKVRHQGPAAFFTIGY